MSIKWDIPNLKWYEKIWVNYLTPTKKEEIGKYVILTKKYKGALFNQRIRKDMYEKYK